MTTVTFIEEVDGRTVESEEEIATSPFAIKYDGQLYEPEVVTDIEFERSDENATTHDQCGNTERTATTTQGWLVRVQGIITANETRVSNASMPFFRDIVAPADAIEVRTDVVSGRFTVGNLVISQPNDLVGLTTVSTDGMEQAFEFQLQLGEEAADS
jgi:hypothetical protein